VTVEHLNHLWLESAFRPNSRYGLLALDHVPFDQLLAQDRYEFRLINHITEPGALCLVLGLTGTGKSSLISWACTQLPLTHVPLRVPVATLESPGDTTALIGTILATAQQITPLTDVEHDELIESGADARTWRMQHSSTGGRLGGGPIPAELHHDIAGVSAEYTREALAADRFNGLQRLAAVFTARDKQLVLVFEDTDAMAGGPGAAAEEFLEAVRVIARESSAQIIVAIQDHRREGLVRSWPSTQGAGNN
jgi:hypothetical protein